MQKIKISTIWIVMLLGTLIFVPHAYGATPETSFIFDAGTGTITGFTGSETVIDIPATIGGVAVVRIGNDVFATNGSITSVTFPSGLKTIGRASFNFCNGLTSIVIPSSVTTIEDYGFYQCGNLASVDIQGSGLVSIGVQAFGACSELTSVNLPSSVTSMAMGVFYDCNKLTSVTLPSGITNLGSYVFYNCTSLTSVTLPSSLTILDVWSFAGCTNLTSINLPSGITSIGQYAFYDCVNLSSVTLPSNLLSLGGWSFLNCTSLTSVTLPSKLARIEESAFQDCTGLTSITIPASVTEIRDWAFHGCASLASATFRGNAPGAFGNGVFESCDEDFNIKYYSSAEGWSTPLWHGYKASAINVVVSYNSNGGTPTPVATVATGPKITAPASPTRYGYIFAGWYQDSALTKRWDFDLDTLTYENLTLYAKWAVDPAIPDDPETYTITFSLNGGANPGTAPSAYTSGEGAALPIPARAGYKFLGWYDNPNFTGDIVQAIGADATGDKAYYAKWAVESYSITKNIEKDGMFSGLPATADHAQANGFETLITLAIVLLVGLVVSRASDHPQGRTTN